jgi:hypothetical protein
MNDPVKIIWKYKNNNRRIQYNTYIFIGNLIPKQIQTILDKIIDLNFYDTLTTLHKDDIKKLVEYYGEEWYVYFFNIYHITSSIIIIKDSPTQKNEIIDKFSSEWYEKHINSKKLIEKKIIYSYDALIKDDRTRKIQKKLRNIAFNDDLEETDFSISKKQDIKKLLNDKENGINYKNDKIDINKMYSKSIIPKKSKNLNFSSDSDSLDFSSDSINSYSLSDSEYLQKGGNMYPLEYEFKIGSNQSLDNFHKNNGSVVINRNKNNNYQNGGKSKNDETEEDDEQNTEDEENTDDEDEDDEDDEDDDADEDEQNTENTEDDDDEVEKVNIDDENKIEKFINEEELDLEEIEQMYKENDLIDTQLKETTNLIKKALNDDKIFEKKIKNMTDFDNSKDDNMYDENLRDIYKKYYVKSHYISKDDTIMSIKTKICCGIKMNSNFDSDLYLTPSRQYFWSEYSFENKINKLMIGLKWIRKQELLNIDIEPLNNIRVYEELRGPLKSLRDSVRKMNNKIKMENDEFDILEEYDQFVTNNEIYMIDIYNEFGLGYNPDLETLKNLQDVYLKIYFPKIKIEDVKSIIDLLNKNKKNEIMKSVLIFESLNNNLIMENEITNTIEEIKMQNSYHDYFKQTYLTHSNIHANLKLVNNATLSLFRIFNEFIVNEQYPFIQYQTPDGNIVYKFNENQILKYSREKNNKHLLLKWFENAPYGLSFKIRLPDEFGIDKFMSIGLSDNGKIEYKVQRKEEDMTTVDDIKNTYKTVKDLLLKINSETNKLKFEIPEDSDFKFAFVNTIQQFVLPNNYLISHNNLSNFSRYFYPYISLVIEPRKRQSKNIKQDIEKSKFGTYLRYKRVSKYENQAKIEQRIMYFIRNFEFTEKSLAHEISKQFNITEEKALDEYVNVKQKYPNLKKSRKILKKMENIPKYKLQGIGIDIQGKTPDKYKIKISGARNKEQLDKVINFINILIYLYVETYHIKKPDRQVLIKKLELLKNIAVRTHKVDEIVDYSKEISNIKQMASIDKRRIGFTPEKGQNQYSRSCQNSGKDKKRQPKQYSDINMDDLLKKGYFLNKKTGNYEKRVIVKEKGKKKEYTLKTVKLTELDTEGNLTGNEIHYACDPEDHGDNIFIGFLTKSTNPFGHCMPCCFKKNKLDSKNKEQFEFQQKCLKQISVNVDQDNKKVSGDKLYILQDTNKIQEGRFGFLPKYLDIYINYSLNKQKKIKHNYLVKSDLGYFFKYGSKQDNNQFMNAIGSLFDLTVDELKTKIITFLDKDKNDQIFTSLNNGDIKTFFKTREHYINFIKDNDFLDFEMCNDILSTPQMLEKHGLNLIIFYKSVRIIKKTFEKEKITEDFYLQCQTSENVYGLKNTKKKCVFMLRENKNYYPIVMVKKQNELDKSVEITKSFDFNNDDDNIVNHVSDFYDKNCANTFMDNVIYKNISLTAKMVNMILDVDMDKKYKTKYQFIDVRNKCKYILTSNDILLPVRPSGSIVDIQIIKSIDKYIGEY